MDSSSSEYPFLLAASQMSDLLLLLFIEVLEVTGNGHRTESMVIQNTSVAPGVLIGNLCSLYPFYVYYQWVLNYSLFRYI